MAALYSYMTVIGEQTVKAASFNGEKYAEIVNAHASVTMTTIPSFKKNIHNDQKSPTDGCV